jgi:hypothetical protein
MHGNKKRDTSVFLYLTGWVKAVALFCDSLHNVVNYRLVWLIIFVVIYGLYEADLGVLESITSNGRVMGEWWIWKICKETEVPYSSYDSGDFKWSIPSIFYISVHHLFSN